MARINTPEPAAAGHLYRHDSGEWRDTIIERLFLDITNRDLSDPVCHSNLDYYAREYFFRDCPTLPADAFTNEAAAVTWASSLGIVHLSKIVDGHRRSDPTIEVRGATHACRFESGGLLTTTVCAQGVGLTALLSVVQFMREKANAHNNPVGGPKLRLV